MRIFTMIMILVLAILMAAPSQAAKGDNGRPKKVREINQLCVRPMMGNVERLSDLQRGAVKYRQRIVDAVLKMGHRSEVAEQILDKIAHGEVHKDNIKSYFGRDEAIAYFSNMSFMRSAEVVGILPYVLLNTGINEVFWVIETQIEGKVIHYAIMVRCGNLSRIDHFEVECPPPEPEPELPELEFPPPTADVPPPPAAVPPPVPQAPPPASTTSSTTSNDNRTSSSTTVVYNSTTDNSDHRQITIVLPREEMPMRLRGLPATKFDRGRTENLGTMSSGISFERAPRQVGFRKKITATGGEGGKVTTSSSTSTSSSSSSSSNTAAAANGGTGGGSGTASAGSAGDGSAAAAAAAEATGTGGSGGSVDFEVDFEWEI